MDLEKLRTEFAYNASTGVLTRLYTGRGIAKTAPTGWLGSSGRMHVRVHGRTWLQHRLIWYIVHGELPSEIDHVDGNGANNRLNNLRAVSHAENMHNMRRPQRNNTSGFLGVSHVGNLKTPWKATIQKNRKKVHLGFFDTPVAAHAAYLEAKRNLHTTCSI